MVKRGRGRPRVVREPVAEVNPIGDDRAGIENVADGENVGAAGEAAQAVNVEPQVEAQQQAGQNQMGEMMGLLTQLLDRFPRPVPAPEVPPRVDEPPRVANQDVREGVAVVGLTIPPYLTVLDHMQRLGTKFFSGGANPVEADEWRLRLERNFLSVRCPEEYQVDLAVHYLEGDAHLWWRSVLARRPNGVVTWREFCEEFDLKYFPQEAMDRLEGEFLDLCQGTKSVREYETEFNRLRRFAGRGLEDEQAQVRRFLRGMRLELKNRCIVRTYASVAELVEKAAMIEEGLKEEAKIATSETQAKKSFGSGSGKSGKFGKGQKRKWEGTPKSGTSVQTGCFRCGSKEHRIATCPSEDVRTCYYCKEVGHIKTSCPKLQPSGAKSGTPPPKRATVTPRAYSLSIESGEASNSKPITG